MKHLLIAVIGMTLISVDVQAGDKAELEDDNARINYSLGYQIGGDLKRQQVEVNREALLQGIEDAVAGSEPAMSQAAMRAALIALKRKVMAQQHEAQAAAAKKNQEAGEAFLAANAKKDGVVGLPSGLQYRVLEPGSGRQPGADDTFTVHYRGTLIDGTEFDSSYSRNQPLTLRLDRVVPGWREALPLMREGAKWELFLPAKLAYGARGAGKIPPYSTLIFEVELISAAGDEGQDTAAAPDKAD
jgi:FKBP-type peptidyl-prolyl cis-trans isomerase FklB